MAGVSIQIPAKLCPRHSVGDGVERVHELEPDWHLIASLQPHVTHRCRKFSKHPHFKCVIELGDVGYIGYGATRSEAFRRAMQCFKHD